MIRSFRVVPPPQGTQGLGRLRKKKGPSEAERLEAQMAQDRIAQQAQGAAAGAALARALEEAARRQGNADLAAKMQAAQQEEIARQERLAASASNPDAVRAASAATNLRLTLPTGVITTYTQALNDTVAAIVKPQLYPEGTQLYKAEPETWVMLQYPSGLRPCNLENQLMSGTRTDLYNRAQDALAQLMQVPPKWSQLQAPLGSQDRNIAAGVAADWFMCVYGWVSLAFFATNVQPRFLLPDAPGQTILDAQGVVGQIAPNRLGAGSICPPEIITAINELKGGGVAMSSQGMIDKIMSKTALGPMWMGFYDKGEASGWQTATFAPQYDELWVNEYKMDRIRPKNFAEGTTTNASGAKIAKDMQNPWYFWYYMFLHALPEDGSVYAFTEVDEGAAGRDKYQGVIPVPGTYTTINMALGWCRLIVTKSITDHVMDAMEWYTNNHVGYWAARGLVESTIDEARGFARTAATAKIDANGQSAQRTIDAVGGAVIAVASVNPISLVIAVAAVAIAKGICALFTMRRKKKAKKKVDAMQPLVFRTLAEMPCTAFDPSMTLPATLQSALANITMELAASGDAANRVAVDVPAPSLVPAPDGTVQPLPQPVAFTVPAAALAEAPVSLPAVVGSEDAIVTTTSSSQPTSTTPQPMPTNGQITQAVVQSQTAPLPMTQPPANPQGSLTWLWVGGGVAALAGLLAVFRKK